MASLPLPGLSCCPDSFTPKAKLQAKPPRLHHPSRAVRVPTTTLSGSWHWLSCEILHHGPWRACWKLAAGNH